MGATVYAIHPVSLSPQWIADPLAAHSSLSVSSPPPPTHSPPPQWLSPTLSRRRWGTPRRLCHEQGRLGSPGKAAVRAELQRVRREVPHGVRREEEGHGDPQPRDGDQ